MLSQSYNIIIDCGLIVPVHVIEVLDGLIDTDKGFIFHLMPNVKLPGSKRFVTQITVHTATQNTDVILSQGFQKYLSN